MADAPTTAYTEVQIDDDSISLTLISESQDGATIEDTERFTFDELQDMAGEHLTLRLSDDSRTALADSRESAVVGNLLEDPTGGTGGGSNLPEVGDIVLDGNPPSWSQDDRLEVVGISDKSADEYVVQENVSFHLEDESVADVNPSCEPDEPVIECVYRTDINPDGTYDESDVYAFPLSRLEDT